MDLVVIALADGSWIVLIVAVLMLIAVIYGYYTRTGSAIDQHPRANRRTETAPGAEGRSELSGRDEGERDPLDQRGTR
jgi:hypothetical protein